MERRQNQKDRLLTILRRDGLVRARDIEAAGIAATTVSRAVATGEVNRVARGLYELSGRGVDSNDALAEVSRRIPAGRICLLSAMAFHGLTDQMPRKVWIAINARAWMPAIKYPPTRIVRFQPAYFDSGVEHHVISGMRVPVYSIEKSLADVYRNPRLVARGVAIECLRNALEVRSVTPARLASVARENGAWRRMQSHLEALTANG